MRNPVPFIVGIHRSGTTLLRLMLDAHHDLAIPPESFLIPQFKLDDHVSKAHFLYHLRESMAWVDFDFDSPQFLQLLDSEDPFYISHGIRSFYQAYAQSFGKSRWGNKSPEYFKHMALITEFLPEVRFIHLIRDGRDVAMSNNNVDPTLSLVDVMHVWTHHILEARDAALSQPYYLEVKYEDLLQDTPKVLKRICDFIDIWYDERMLYYHKYARARFERMPDDKVHGWFDLTSQLPNQRRIGTHKMMDKYTLDSCNKIGGDLLRALGYEV